MSESTESATTVDDTAADVTRDVDATDTQLVDPSEPTPNREAARYRVQMREAEAERDAMAERLTAYQRRECEAAVAGALDVPGDLWEVGGADVTAFYNDDGSVNEAELLGAAAALVDQRPRLGKPGPPKKDWGQQGGVWGGDGKVGWSDVISPR